MKINLYQKRRSSSRKAAEAAVTGVDAAGTVDRFETALPVPEVQASMEAPTILTSAPAPIAVLEPVERQPSASDPVVDEFGPPVSVPELAVVTPPNEPSGETQGDASTELTPTPTPPQAPEVPEVPEASFWEGLVVVGGSVLLCVNAAQPPLTALNNGSPLTLELASGVAVAALVVFFASCVKVQTPTRPATSNKTSVLSFVSSLGRRWSRKALLGTAIGLGILAAGGIRHPYQFQEDVEGTILRRDGSPIVGAPVLLPERSGLNAVLTSPTGGFLFRGVPGRVSKLRVRWDGEDIDFPRKPGGAYRVIPNQVLASEQKWTPALARWTAARSEGAALPLPAALAAAGFSYSVLYEGRVTLPASVASGTTLSVRVSLRPLDASDFRLAAVSSNLKEFETQPADGPKGYFQAEYSPGDLPPALSAWRQLQLLSEAPNRPKLLGTVGEDRLCMTLVLRDAVAVASARKGLAIRIRLASRRTPGPVAVPPLVLEASPSASN